MPAKKPPKSDKRARDASAVPEPAAAVQPICSLPLVGATTLEDAVFYGAVGALALAELVSWPTATLFAGAHALHQRTRNVIRTGAMGEAREGLIEAFDDMA
ncbi:MAG: hypothetical protein JO240_08640 [Solirubrobacterales bacterium]|nr:hypothetical protein [Solirubrobacterales bacterium]